VFRHAIYWLLRVANPPVCALRIQDGRVQLVKGRPPPAFVSGCSDIAAHFAIRNGHVDCVAGPRGLTLRFSPDVPAASHQRFRNVLGMHRHRG
jgi:hypothetical protein